MSVTVDHKGKNKKIYTRNIERKKKRQKEMKKEREEEEEKYKNERVKE